MNATPSTSSLNGDRIADKARTNIERVADQFYRDARDTATVAYDATFWTKLQTQLESVARQYRIALADKNHDAARELRDIEHLGVVIAVEEFRGRVQDDPYKIQDPDLWDEFKQTIFTAVDTPIPDA